MCTRLRVLGFGVLGLGFREALDPFSSCLRRRDSDPDYG